MNRRETLLRYAGCAVAGILVAGGARAALMGEPAQAWAPWLAAAAVVLAVVWAVSGAVLDKREQRRIAAEARDEEPLVSLVLLLRQPRYLDEGLLCQMVRAAWDIRLSDAEDGGNFVVGESPSFIVMAEGRTFLVNNSDAPYFTDGPLAASQVKDLRLRKAVNGHRAWMSVDLMCNDEAPVEEAYRWIGKLIAELAADDCLAILSPQTGWLHVYNRELRRTLCGGDPLAVFSQATTAAVLHCREEDDPRMRLAVDEAKRCWPEFVEAFENRGEDQHFSVRVPFSDGVHTELMWMTVTAIENSIIYGRLGNEPLSIRGMRQGAIVRAPVQNVSDWAYTQGEHIRGNFTVQAMRRAGDH